MATFEETLRMGTLLLKEAGIDDASIDAWYLFEYVFKVNRVSYYARLKENADSKKQTEYLSLIDERKKHVPLQYITGTQEFMGLLFNVGPEVLIPRQDTEILIEEVLKVCKNKSVLDMCTGSGCIIVSLSKLGEIKNGTGVDISKDALKVAKQNGEKHNVDITWMESNLFESLNNAYDIIVSNPPYIASTDVLKLMPEVKDHEPRLALDGLEDGLFFYREIISELKNHLNKGGYVFFEIGYNQGEEVKALLLEQGFKDVKVVKDLANLDRVVYGINV